MGTLAIGFTGRIPISSEFLQKHIIQSAACRLLKIMNEVIQREDTSKVEIKIFRGRANTTLALWISNYTHSRNLALFKYYTSLACSCICLDLSCPSLGDCSG